MGKMTINIDSRKLYRIMEDSIMPAIVEFPTVVKEALEEFGPFFDNEPERKHFAEYLTGLMIANDYIIINYVCTSGKHYPLEFYRFVKKEHCDKRGIEFVDHNQFVRWQIDWVVKKDIP